MLYLFGLVLGVGFGVAIAAVGCGLAQGRAVAAALEGAARQPEAAGTLQTMMIIPAAMIEGLGLLALVVAFLGVLTLNKGVATVSAGATPAAAEAPARH